MSLSPHYRPSRPRQRRVPGSEATRPEGRPESVHSHAPGGFTLVEILLVLVLVFILLTIGIPSLSEAIDKANIAHAIGDVRALSNELMTLGADGELPNSLEEIGRGGMSDPWGEPYVYRKFDGPRDLSSARKDKFLVPLNTDFDLYSKGKDGASTSSLSASMSLDDIIRANDGGWIGLAEKY